MIETKETTLTLNGTPRRVQVTQLPAMRAMKLLTRLGAVLGPGLAKLADGDRSKLDSAVRDLFERLTESEVEHLIRTLFETARIDLETGESREVLKVFDAEFAGDVGAVIKLIGFGLEVNFGNFLAGLGDLAAKLPRAAQPSKPSIT